MASNFLKNMSRRQSEEISQEFGANAYGGSDWRETIAAAQPTSLIQASRTSSFLRTQAQKEREKVDEQYGEDAYGGSNHQFGARPSPSPSLPETEPVAVDTGRGGGFGSSGRVGGAALSGTPKAKLSQAIQSGDAEKAGAAILGAMAGAALEPAAEHVLQSQEYPAVVGGTLLQGIDQAAGSITSTLAAGEDLLLGALGNPEGDGPLQALNRWVQEGNQRTAEALRPHFERAGAFGDIMETYGIPTVAAIPQAALAYLTAGASAGAQGTTAGLRAAASAANAGLGASIVNGIRTMAGKPNYWLSFAQGAGNDYYEAKENGASDLEASAYATLTNLLNSVVEVGGGIDTLPGSLQSAAGQGKSAVWEWVKSAFDEGKEEVIQGAISQLTENAVLGADNPLYSATDQRAVLSPSRAGQEFLGGAVAGGILGAGQALVNSAVNRNGGARASAGAQESAMPVSGDPLAETAPQAAETPILDAEVQRLYGQQNAAPEAETAVNENGLTALTNQERINLSSGVRNKIVSTFQDAVSFVRNALTNRQNTDRAYLGKVPDTTAQRVQADTGVNISGYNAIIPSGAVRHMFNRHGDPNVEASRGQRAITPEDVARIPDIIANPDRVALSSELDVSGRPALLFEKDLGDRYITVQAVSDGTHSIQADTLYIRKKNSQDTVSDAGTLVPAPNSDVQNVPPQSSSVNSIPDVFSSVNAGTAAGDPDIARSVGAAARGFDPYTRQLEQFGAIPEGENAARPIDVPRRTSPENRVSRTARTILEAAATPDSAVGDIGQAVVDGRFSYMPVSNESARIRAEETIRKKGWEDALADWRADVRAGRTSEQITSLGATLYNNAINAGDTKTALDIAYDMSVAIRNGARATQAARILKTLTPTGRLYMLQKEVSRLNEQNQSRARRGIRTEDNVPVELWMQRVGENLADRLAARASVPRETAQTVSQTILSDLQRFADETAPKRTGRQRGRTELDRITDLFRNRANYEEAWQAAKDTLSDTFENDLQALETFDAWLDSSLDYIDPLTRELTGQSEIRIDASLADAYLNAETDGARAAALQAIYQDIADQMPANFREKWNAWRYMAMLTNLRTHVRNVLGNVGFQPLRMVKNLVATAIESGMNAAGIPVERAHSFLASPDLYRAAWADYQNVADVLSGNKYNDPQSQIDGRRRVFRNRALETVRKGNSRALELEDAIFKRFTYADTLANYLRANGVTAEQLQGGQVDTALLERARDYAGQEALRATYQDRNAFSNRVNQIARDMGPVGDAILPFRRTPANILVRGVEYSPAGLAKALTYDLYQVQRGNKTAAEAIDGVAAGLTGSALMALGAYLFSEGIVTDGGGDSDDDEWNELMGHQSYALELPNGTSVTLDWLAPESLPFFMGVSLASSMGENGMDAESIYDALRSVADPMLELSMLQSVNDLIDSVQYAEEAPLAAMIPSTVISYFSQAIPTLGGQIERTGEDRRMTTYTDRNSSIPTDVQYAIGRASSRIPGWDYQQTPYIDAWGREEETGDELERFANNFLNPAYVSQVDVDEVEQELQRIRDATGDTSVFPDRARRYITVDGERKDLTAEEYDTYARTLGQTRYTLLLEAMELPGWRGMTDGEKAEYIGDLYEYAGAVAKAAVSDYKLDGWIANAHAAEREIGVSTAEYIALYEQYGSSLMSGQGYEKLKEAVENGLSIDEYADYRDATSGLSADKDESGKTISGSKKEKVLAAIDEMDLSDEEKDWLYYLNGYAESAIGDAPWRQRR